MPTECSESPLGLPGEKIIEVACVPSAGQNGDAFVHDTTIVGDRVYVAYWEAGLIILEGADYSGA